MLFRKLLTVRIQRKKLEVLILMRSKLKFNFNLRKKGKSGTRLYHLIVKTYWKHTNTSQSLLISKPLQIEIKFDLPSQKITKIVPALAKVDQSPPKKSSEDIVYSKTKDVAENFQDDESIESNIANLLFEESEIKADKEQQEISMSC